MIYAICCIPVSPLRKEPSHRSEMVSQQLFGEACTVIGQTDDGWLHIKCSYEGYEGWCPEADLVACDRDEYNRPIAGLASDWINEGEYRSQKMLLPMGSSIRTVMPPWEGVSFHYKGRIWNPSTAEANETTIQQLAFSYLNTSYVWGGKSVFGIDCSGFTQTIYKFLNYRLERDAYEQEQQGTLLSSLLESRCGDLAFFNNPQGRITHVGILLNDHEIIHASGRVRIDNIDADGIIQAATLERTHKLFSVRRYFD